MSRAEGILAPADSRGGSPSNEIALDVGKILASPTPSDALQDFLIETETRPEFGAAVFEAVAPRIKITHYWTYYRISRAYFLLGRDDACFATALAAIQMQPNYQNWHMYQNIYRYFCSRGRYREAVEIARHQIAHTPEIPVVSPDELAHVVRQANMPPADEFNVDEKRTRHLVHPESTFELGPHRRYGIDGGKTKCFALDAFGGAKARPEVVVWELESPEVVVFDRNVLIFDNKRVLQPDISVCEYPEALARKIAEPALYDSLSVATIDDALVISDKYGTANVCHFLYDHVTRLALYEPFCSITNALVVGPALVTDYQARIVRRIGINAYQGTDERRVIRPSRLFVSGTCKKTFVHPAHIAAEWAIAFLKRRFVFEPSDTRDGRRIYISRKDATVRFLSNETDVLAHLHAAGFAEVVLSELDYDEQAALFARSTHIVGMHGAGLSNIVFCPTGAHVLEICHPVSGTAAYAVVGCSLDIEYAALVGRDAASDEAMYNDAAAASLGLGMGGAQVLSNRDVVVDLRELDRWLNDSGAAA